MVATSQKIEDAHCHYCGEKCQRVKDKEGNIICSVCFKKQANKD